MFEFATSQHKRKPLSQRLMYSSGLSLAGHALAVFLLVQFPELLQPGRGFWFLRPVEISRKVPDPYWRMVTFVPMAKLQEPHMTSIRKYLYDAVEAASHQPSPPIRVQWNEEKTPSHGDTDRAAKPVQPALGTQDPKPVPTIPESTKTQQPTEAAQAPAGGASRADAAGKSATVYLPAPQATGAPKEIPRKVAETSANTAPARIPDATEMPTVPGTGRIAKTPNSTPAKTAAQVFENEQKAIQTEGSGLFNTQGFPLGDYATIIIERVKGNWLIPSNLRNSQGRCTVIFFIGKDGRYTDVKIVTSSGSKSLDITALMAVIESNPFPPLPRGFPGDHVGAKFVFSYNERQ